MTEVRRGSGVRAGDRAIGAVRAVSGCEEGGGESQLRSEADPRSIPIISGPAGALVR